MGTVAESFMTARTVYEAEITWWWVDSKVHDQDYKIMVNESMRKKAKELESKYDVTDDTRYCCQWEGVLLFGDNKAKVDAAGLELARHLARFKGIISLNIE
jgi:hypothetical protein